MSSTRTYDMAGIEPLPAPRLDELLTPRQAQVARLVACGLSNKEIGRRLGISARTTKRHLSNIYCKLRVQSGTQLVALLFCRQLLTSSDVWPELAVQLGCGQRD